MGSGALVGIGPEPALSRANPRDPAAIKAVCQEFEALFLQMLLKELRRGELEEGILPKSNARRIFESLLDEQLAREMSKAGGVGLAEMLVRQLNVAQALKPAHS